MFSPKRGVEPAILGLILSSKGMIEAYDAISIGSIPRRRRAPWQDFLALPVLVPPLAEQRRIVDLIGAVDEAIGELQESLRAARQVMAHLRRIEGNNRFVGLGDLCVMRSGPSFAAADMLVQPEPGAVPLLGIPNTPASGQLALDRISYVRGVPASSLRLDESSLVLIRTNGNRSRIGNVYRADRRTAGFVVSAFQIALKPHDPAESAFLYWYLGSPDVQAEISASASGSTGLGNVAVSWLKSLQIPRLTSDEVAAYVERCEAAGAVIAGQAEELQSLEALRGNLLTALLSGAHEIPAGYDEFLTAAQ